MLTDSGAATRRQHHYRIQMSWSGNLGNGTHDYRSYSRSHDISAEGKPLLPGSADPHFRGDPARYNPEELLVAALSSCHMLSYLHLCANHGIVVEEYVDSASGVMNERTDGSGAFVEVVLKPEVIISAGDVEKAISLHEEAHHLCFIANSVNFPVRAEPRVRVR